MVTETTNNQTPAVGLLTAADVVRAADAARDRHVAPQADGFYRAIVPPTVTR